jgi:hypothetical protein
MATKIGPKTVSQRDRSKALVFCIDAAHLMRHILTVMLVNLLPIYFQVIYLMLIGLHTVPKM